MILFINGFNYKKNNLTSLPKSNKSSKNIRGKRKERFLLVINTVINS